MSTAQLVLERGKVSRPVAELCQGGQVRVAYNQYSMPVDIETNRWAEQSLSISIKYRVAWLYEILDTFFHEHKITPTFIDDNGTYSEYDEEAGEWTGVVGLVSNKDIV